MAFFSFSILISRQVRNEIPEAHLPMAQTHLYLYIHKPVGLLQKSLNSDY